MTNLEHQIKLFADRWYGERDVPSRFRKLGEEIGELGEAIARGGERAIVLEAGDVGVVLADLLAVLGEGHSLSLAMATVLDRKEEQYHREKRQRAARRRETA